MHSIQRLLFTLVLSFVLISCQSKPAFRAPDGKVVRVELAKTDEDKTRGLSGRASKDFADDQAMLFWYDDSGPRRYWMPNTHFDLDIFFLDKDFVVLDVERNVPHYPFDATAAGIHGPVPTTRTVYAQHVLEMRASSALSKSLQPGQKIQWIKAP